VAETLVTSVKNFRTRQVLRNVVGIAEISPGQGCFHAIKGFVGVAQSIDEARFKTGTRISKVQGKVNIRFCR
jgi:hypothetical protein